jgi:hypothetical protein
MMHSTSIFRLGNRKWYPWLFLGLCILVIPLTYQLLPAGKGIEGILPAIGLVGGFVAFLYTQHLQQSRLFKELFTDFNLRYYQLNEGLNAIRSRPIGTTLEQADTKILFDYFNLCAEEFLFFRAGHIDLDVWRSWCRGMQEFMNDPEIRQLWEVELKSGSYYGFTIDEPSRV